MYITVLADGSLRLDEPDVFTEFAVRLESRDPKIIDAALWGLGPTHVEDRVAYVFVPVHWLRDHAGGRNDQPDWSSGLESMVAFASSKGWTDADGRIRAHIEAR